MPAFGTINNILVVEVDQSFNYSCSSSYINLNHELEQERREAKYDERDNEDSISLEHEPIDV